MCMDDGDEQSVCIDSHFPVLPLNLCGKCGMNPRYNGVRAFEPNLSCHFPVPPLPAVSRAEMASLQLSGHVHAIAVCITKWPFRDCAVIGESKGLSEHTTAGMRCGTGRAGKALSRSCLHALESPSYADSSDLLFWFIFPWVWES